MRPCVYVRAGVNACIVCLSPCVCLYMQMSACVHAWVYASVGVCRLTGTVIT